MPGGGNLSEQHIRHRSAASCTGVPGQQNGIGFFLSSGFGGGAGAGVKIDPVAFLIIKDGVTRMMPVAVSPKTTMDRIVDMAPELMDKVEKYLDKKHEKETV